MFHESSIYLLGGKTGRGRNVIIGGKVTRPKRQTRISIGIGYEEEDYETWNKLHAVQIATGATRDLAGMSTARFDHSAVLRKRDSSLVTCGGGVADDDGSTCESYNISANVWSSFPSLGRGKGALKLAECRGVLYAVGRLLDGNSIERFEDDASTWSLLHSRLTTARGPMLYVDYAVVVW